MEFQPPTVPSSTVTDLQHFLQLKTASGAALEEAMVTIRLVQASCSAGRSGNVALGAILQAQRRNQMKRGKAEAHNCVHTSSRTQRGFDFIVV